MNNKVTYRHQYTRCGKQRCRKCKEGQGHGPYWYAFWSENGRTISKYIGLHLPVDVDEATLERLAPRKEAAMSDRREMAESSETSETVGKAGKPAERTTAERLSRPITAGEGGPHLRIYLLGQFRIEVRDGDEWVPVSNRTWQRKRARALLGCLLSSSGRRLGREQAMEALWPDLDIETAANRLNGAVHEVRQVLEPDITRPAASRMLRLDHEVLTLADASQIWVDAEDFESLLKKTNTFNDADLIEQSIDEALKLYCGDYLLEELYAEWAAPRRESLRRGWMGALLKSAELRGERGAFTSAIEPLDRLLATEPTHETAVRRLMVLLTQLDRRGEAFRVYQRLLEALRHEGENAPLAETSALYEAIRSGTFQVPSLAIAKQDTPGLAATTPPEKQEIMAFPRPALQLGRLNQSRLVGREQELEAMQHFLLSLETLLHDEARALAQDDEATAGDMHSGDLLLKHARSAGHATRNRLPHLLLLMGESGIGKTRLAEEISYEANLRGWSVAWAHAYEQEGTIPYRHWTEIFRTLLHDVRPASLLAMLEAQTEEGIEREAAGDARSASPAQAKLARLSTLVPELGLYESASTSALRSALTLPIEQERLHLWEAASALLGMISRSAPLLLVLDDLHWTDDSSLELLAYAVRHLRNERIAIIATCRDIELSPTSNLRILINDLRREQAITTLNVQPLDKSHIGSLVAHLPEHIVQSILVHAGGNPFFAEELARVSEASQQLFSGHTEGKTRGVPGMTLEHDLSVAMSQTPAMPDTIAAVLDRRLGRLSSDCQALLGKIAVLGGSFEFTLVAYMAGEQTNEDSLLDLLEEALNAGLLTEEGTGSRIIYHFWHPLIVSHLYERVSAARRAQLHRRAAQGLIHLHQGSEEDVAAVAAAITHHLMRGGSDSAQIARYAEMAGNRAYSLSAYTEAEHYYRQVIEAHARGSQETGDELHLASLLERVAECNMIHGNFDEVRRLLEQVMELRTRHRLQAGESMYAEEAQRQALLWREIGRSWADNGYAEQAAQCYDHGTQVLIDAGVTSGAAWACLHLAHGNIDWRKGNYDEARRFTQEALAMLEQAIARQDRATPQLAPNELPTRTALAMSGNPLDIGSCHEHLGIIAATLCQYPEALEHLNNALAIYKQHDQVTSLSLVYGNLGSVYAARAENDTARAFYQRALDMAKRTNNAPIMSFVIGNLGDVATRCGNLLEAEEWIRQSLVLAERISDFEQMSWVHTLLGMALLDLGHMSDALSHIRRGIAIGRSIKSVLCVSFALVALGEWRINHAIDVCNVDFVDQQDISQYQEYGALLTGARRALQRALAMEGLNSEIETEGQLALASAHFLLGEIGIAHEKALQSLQQATSNELTQVVGRSYRLLGRILAEMGKSAEADAHFEQALDLFSHHEMRLDYARALHGYSITIMQRSSPGDPTYQRGIESLYSARDIFQQCSAAIDINWVERILSRIEHERAGI